MATVILRPTVDDSLKHLCSSGSSGYAMLSEVSADGDSTYVYQSISGTSSETAGSRFKCGGAGVGKIKISSVTLTVNAKTTKGNTSDTAKITYWLTSNTTAAGGVGQSVLTTSYSDFTKTYSDSDLNIADKVFDSFDAANFLASVLTAGAKNSKKNDDFQNRVTQIYLTVEYTPVSDTTTTGIYLKQNGAYTQAQAAYKKVNGVWTTTDKTAIDTTKNYRLIKT